MDDQNTAKWVLLLKRRGEYLYSPKEASLQNEGTECQRLLEAVPPVATVAGVLATLEILIAEAGRNRECMDNLDLGDAAYLWAEAQEDLAQTHARIRKLWGTR